MSIFLKSNDYNTPPVKVFFYKDDLVNCLQSQLVQSDC